MLEQVYRIIPTNGDKVVYIGCTNQTLQKRLSTQYQGGQSSRAFLEKFATRYPLGTTRIQPIKAPVHPSEAAKLENAAMRHHIAMGYEVLNTRQSNKGHFSAYVDSEVYDF